MTVQEQTNPQDEAQKIWDQLDAEETGKALPDDKAEGTQATESTDSQQQSDQRQQAPADQADASAGAGTDSHEQSLMDKIAGLESMLGQVTTRLRNAEGHIGGLNGQLKQQQQLAKQVSNAGGDAPTSDQVRQAQSDPAAMANLKRDYPEFADAMESALKQQLQEQEHRFKALLENQKGGVSHEEIAQMRSELAVETKHPGWQDRVQTPEFMGWLQRQQPEVQMLAASESPRDAIRLLDLHNEAINSVASQNKSQRLSSAAAIPSGRSAGSSARSKAVEDMTPQEYWRYLDEIDKQKGK
jgi:hypothetical protein